MKKLILLSLFFGACSLISPYQITFTTPEGTSVDPATDTLDFVVSAATIAYISEAECEGAEDIELLPVLTDDMVSKTAYNLPLIVLMGQAPASTCTLTVTAFDQTTTSSARAKIDVVIAGEVPTDENEAAENTEEAPDETTETEEEAIVNEEPMEAGAPESAEESTEPTADVEVETVEAVE